MSGARAQDRPRTRPQAAAQTLALLPVLAVWQAELPEFQKFLEPRIYPEVPAFTVPASRAVPEPAT